MQLCSRCGEHQTRRENTSWCVHCHRADGKRRWNEWTPQRRRTKWLKTKYDMTWDEYELMFTTQDGKCAVCSKEIILLSNQNGNDTACVDHDHSTGKIRGLLCNHCNRALGLLGDSSHTIEQLLRYRRSYG